MKGTCEFDVCSWKHQKRWLRAVTFVLMSFLIPVDWTGEGFSALCAFTKDAF